MNDHAETLIDFDAVGAPSVPLKTSVSVREQVTVTPRVVPSAGRSDLVGEEWTWSQLRDYVVAQIEERTGPFPRRPEAEIGIFKGFINRWGDRAAPIARAAFEVHGGYWRSAPISVNRFCANSDPYFAQVIADKLGEGPIKGW